MPSPVTAEAITIRPAREGDLSNLSKLIREHARYEQAGALRPDLETALRAMLFSSAPRLRVLLAVRGDALVGYTSWSMR